MKKLLFLMLLILGVSITSCKNSDKETKNFDNYEYFSNNPSCLDKIVKAENNKAPLTMQEYNKIKNNIVKIEFKNLVITHGTKHSCKGYFTTIWTIKTEYFGEEEYEYLIPCEGIRYNTENDYIIWKIIWPEEHPFADII